MAAEHLEACARLDRAELPLDPPAILADRDARRVAAERRAEPSARDECDEVAAVVETVAAAREGGCLEQVEARLGAESAGPARATSSPGRTSGRV
jgi:hypothetical protein